MLPATTTTTTVTITNATRTKRYDTKTPQKKTAPTTPQHVGQLSNAAYGPLVHNENMIGIWSINIRKRPKKSQNYTLVHLCWSKYVKAPATQLNYYYSNHIITITIKT